MILTILYRDRKQTSKHTNAAAQIFLNAVREMKLEVERYDSYTPASPLCCS